MISCYAVFLVGCVEPTEATGSSRSALSGDNSYVLALGDSLAAGHQLAPERPGHCCTNDGYADQLHRALSASDPTLSLRVLGCGFETTTTMLKGGGLCRYERASQLEEALDWIKNKNPSLVTIDIGANDVLACLQQPNPSRCLPSTFETVSDNLSKILKKLRHAVGPEVPIIGMNYYNPLVAHWFNGPAGPETAIAYQKTIVGPFNDLLEGVYLSAGANAVADVESAFASADFTIDSSLGAASIPPSVANICAYTWMCSAGDIHPNTAGYGVIADTFLALLQ
ncbi:MAG TPA: SGNH/GDSL hydrolase family protein [Myxococcaceae bacterium]|nr:SGNH/GDSL hydrolase family protein [Myxococcaceae bacterium]